MAGRSRQHPQRPEWHVDRGHSAAAGAHDPENLFERMEQLERALGESSGARVVVRFYLDRVRIPGGASRCRCGSWRARAPCIELCAGR